MEQISASRQLPHISSIELGCFKPKFADTLLLFAPLHFNDIGQLKTNDSFRSKVVDNVGYAGLRLHKTYNPVNIA